MKSIRATWSLGALAIFSLSISTAFADFDSDLSPQGPSNSISLVGSAIPSRPAADSNGDFGQRDLSLKGNFILNRDIDLVGGKPTMTAFSIQPKLDRKQVSGLGSLDRDATIYSEGLTVSAFHLSQSGEFYFGGLGVTHTGEGGKSEASLWIPTVYGAGSYHFTRDTALLYGAAFTNTFGIFIPVPVLGLFSKLSPEWTFITILPILTQFTWKPVELWKFAAFLKGSGFESEIANQGQFSGRDSAIKLKSRAFELGMSAGYDASSSFSFKAEVGALFARKLNYEDSAGTIMTQKINAAPLTFLISATYRLPASANDAPH